MKIQRKRVLITGAAVRIGRALVEAFADAGAKLIIHYNKSENAAMKLFDEIGGEAEGHLMIPGDLRKQETLDALIREACCVDVLINNAAEFVQTAFADEAVEDAKKQFDVNYWAPIELMQRFLQAESP